MSDVMPDTDQVISELVGRDRPDWVEPTHWNYVGIAVSFLRRRGRRVDADALDLLVNGTASFLFAKCGLLLLLAIPLVLSATPEAPVPRLVIGLNWRTAVALVAILAAAIAAARFRNARTRLRAVSDEIARRIP